MIVTFSKVVLSFINLKIRGKADFSNSRLCLFAFLFHNYYLFKACNESGADYLSLIIHGAWGDGGRRSEEHTSELQSLMRISYAVFCLKKKKKNNTDDRN